MKKQSVHTTSNIPCKINKCLLYPSCINKKRIKCKLLYQYFRQCEAENDKDHASYSWDKLRKYFKRIILIHPGEPFDANFMVMNNDAVIEQMEGGISYADALYKR